MTASGESLVGTGTVLLMTRTSYASIQAGGDVTTRRQVRGGHRLEVSATRRFFRLMFPRYVHTSSDRGRRSKLNSRTGTGTMCYPARPYRRQPPKPEILRSSTL